MFFKTPVDLTEPLGNSFIIARERGGTDAGMKEHTIWFWLYWGVWLAASLGAISENASGGDPFRLLGNILGLIVFGYIGYRILKWIYDYLARREIPHSG